MYDQLVSWLPIVIGLLGLVPAYLQPVRGLRRRHPRRLRYSRLRDGNSELIQLEMTDDRQS